MLTVARMVRNIRTKIAASTILFFRDINAVHRLAP